ncbi:MAG: hypothetical protein HIU88_10200 [Acidobacteria bacterium]|nr:hypothetical protein [Acidobacteriota bacterium]
MAVSGAQRFEPAHGTEARYNRGDRCPKCKSARAAAVRKRKEAKELAIEVPVTSIDSAPSAQGVVTGVEGSVSRLVQLVADDPTTQVRAQMALALARRLDRGDAGAATISAQLNALLVTLKPVKASGVVADGVAAPRLSALFGSRGRVDPGAVPGSERVAAVGDEA